jgi:crotonobetainyl-CoA:carnitine CoA-transferase CaiB-like acyl-CoA transferase
MQSARLVWADGEPRDGRPRHALGRHHRHPPHRDGHLYLSANTPHFWRALCEKTGLPAIWPTTRATTACASAPSTARSCRAACRRCSPQRAEWEALFGDEVPCAAARRWDMFDHPQVLAEQMIASASNTRCWAATVASRGRVFGRTPGPDAFAAPTLGSTPTRC